MKTKIMRKKYLNNMRRTNIVKVQNSLLELEKDFIGLKDSESKDRKVRIKRKIEELFLNQLLCL